MALIEENVPLGRLTTVGIGGPARQFARPQSLGELEEALAWAAGEGLDGRHDRPRLEPADRRRGRGRARAAARGRAGRGGGRGRAPRRRRRRANAVCLHRARAAGLGGFEFACAIPGTIGGGVQMNAGAYGSDWAAILERALVVSADGSEWRTPEQLGLEYRRSALAPGRGGRAGGVPARAAAAGGDQGDRRRAPGAPEGRAADEQAHLRKRLQEPRARALGGPDARGLRAQGPSHRRRADLAQARELHRERRRGPGDRRARADGGSAPEGARGVRRRARARGAPARRARAARRPGRRCRASARRAELGWVPAARKPTSRTAVLALPSRHGAACAAAVADPPVRPLADRRLRDRRACRGRLRRRPRDVDVRGRPDRGHGGEALGASRASKPRLRRSRERAWSRWTPLRSTGASKGSRTCASSRTTARFRTRRRSSSRPSARSRCCARARRPGS